MPQGYRHSQSAFVGLTPWSMSQPSPIAAPSSTTDPALFDRMFAINTRAPFFLMQDTIKLMIETGTEGTIVNISSMSAMAGQPFIAAYCASKAPSTRSTATPAFALLKNRIRVNALNIAGCKRR